jgi:hypothetical protein
VPGKLSPDPEKTKREKKENIAENIRNRKFPDAVIDKGSEESGPLGLDELGVTVEMERDERAVENEQTIKQ